MKAEDIKNLKIAIVGAGYGGAAAAKALSLLGADVTVYEQAPQMGEVGAGIGLRPATMARFRQWGIFDAVAKVSSPSDYFEILTATGEPIMKDTWPEFGAEKQTYLIHRRDFIEALLGVLPEGMVQLGHRLKTIEDKGGSSVLTFANGESVDHGLVVDDNLRMYIGKGTKVYLLPLRHRNQMSFDITALNPDGTWAPAISKDDLLKTVEGFDERIVGIARGLDIDSVNIRAVYDIDPVDTWHTDSVVLMGDAAHSMLHHQGQGANSAIEDAGALADALAEAGTVKDALALFQATRKPVTDELQRISRQGWTEDEVNDVFPGQKPTSQKPAAVNAPAESKA